MNTATNTNNATHYIVMRRSLRVALASLASIWVIAPALADDQLTAMTMDSCKASARDAMRTKNEATAKIGGSDSGLTIVDIRDIKVVTAGEYTVCQGRVINPVGSSNIVWQAEPRSVGSGNIVSVSVNYDEQEALNSLSNQLDILAGKDTAGRDRSRR